MTSEKGYACDKCASLSTFILTEENTKANSSIVWKKLSSKKDYIIIVCKHCRYEKIKEIESAS